MSGERFLVRCKHTHRLGLVDTVIYPPRPGGRELFVLWEGGLDYSLMAMADVELEAGDPAEDWGLLPPGSLDHPGSQRLASRASPPPPYSP
jgi:hypothetical protein